MKINIMLPAIGQSGGIDVIYKYTELLSEQGHDIVVYKEISAANMHRYTSKLANRLHQLYCTFKAFRAANRKTKVWDKFVWTASDLSIREADVIIATAWPTAYRVAKLNQQKGKKIYFIQDFEVWDNKKLVLNSYRLPLDKIVISTWINNHLTEELGIGPFPIIYNGIDLNVFNDKKRELGKQKRKQQQFLMLNHTLSKKGVSYGVKAFEKINRHYPSAELKMFGMCPAKNLPEYIQYFQNPSKQQLVDLYLNADIFLFPSIEEGWGLTPLEAMACGCIVVGTKTGFTLDIGKHKDNMMISEPGDISGMVNNAEELLNKPELMEHIRKQGLHTVASLDWNRSCKKLLELLMGEKTNESKAGSEK